jgi:ComF family protein
MERWFSAFRGRPNWRLTGQPEPGQPESGQPESGRLAGWVSRGLDALLPPGCPLCGGPVDRQRSLCAACFSRIGFITAPFCERCGVPFGAAGQAAAGLCPSCVERVPAFRRARAALRYDASSRDLILPLKHADRLELAPVLASMMARAGAGLMAGADVLVPVPLHRKRLFHRRYNQAAVLALLLGRAARRPVWPDALMRVRATEALEEKTPEQRVAMVAGAFRVRPHRVSKVVGRTVLLVDDVMTSGATADACAQALLAAGAAAVDVLLAARVPDPRLG